MISYFTSAPSLLLCPLAITYYHGYISMAIPCFREISRRKEGVSVSRREIAPDGTFVRPERRAQRHQDASLHIGQGDCMPEATERRVARVGGGEPRFGVSRGLWNPIVFDFGESEELLSHLFDARAVLTHYDGDDVSSNARDQPQPASPRSRALA